MSHRPRNILVTRTDRMGDVILSLPVAAAIKAAIPAARVTFLVSPYTGPVARMCPAVDDVILLPGAGERDALESVLRRQEFTEAVCLYPRPRIASLLKKARIPVRVGTGRRWYAYCFNRRIGVSRAAGGRHERDFNLALLAGIGIDEPVVSDPVCIPSQEALKKSRTMIGACGVDPERERFVVVHPGCGGSARNWSPERYQDLCRRLSAAGLPVIITGSSDEANDVNRVAGQGVTGITSIAGRISVSELAGVLHDAAAFVGPSTGPMHLAAAVKTPVIALFGPVRTTGPGRWGPLGTGHRVLMPRVPECRCPVQNCKLGDCMAQISPDLVARIVQNTVDGDDREFGNDSKVIEFGQDRPISI